MAGETETKLRIVGTDQTGEAFRSAAQNAERLTNSIRNQMNQQQALFGRLAGGVAGLERRLTAATAAMSVGATLRQSLVEFAATDRRMTRLAQNAEVSGRAVRDFKQELVRMGSEIGIGTESMVAGFETYVRQTGSYDKAKANIRAIGEFAHAVGAEAKEAATTARVLEQSFQIDAGTMPLAFDMIAAAANKGNYEAKDLARSIPELADAAAAAGMHGAKGLSEMLAMMEAISDKVAEPQQVMQGMRDMLARMSQPEMMNNFQKETGINLEAQLNQARRSGKSVSATFVQTIDVGLRNMAKRMNIPLERRNELLARLVPELDSRRAVSALLNGLPRVIDVLNATERAAGTVKRQLADLTNDPQANIQRLEDSWDSLKQSLGQTMVSIGILDGLKSVREEFEGIQRAAKMLDDFMEKVRTKGVLGAVFDSGGEAARNKELINAEELKRDAEERLKLFKGAKADGETDASDGRRHGGLGIPGLGFLSPPIPVDHGIENAERDIAEANDRIARVKREQAAQLEFDDRRRRGIPMSEAERLQHMTNSREAPVTPLDVAPMPAERRVMAPEIKVDPELARRRDELDRLAPPGTDPAIRAAVDQMKRELIQTREGGFTVRRMTPETPRTAPDFGTAPEKPQPIEPAAPLGRPSIILRDRAQPEPVAPAAPMAPNAPAPAARAPDFGRSERLPPGVIDPYAPPPDATFQRQSAEGDAPWKGLIHRTALTTETTDATARGQMDQINETRKSNELLGALLRRQVLRPPTDEGPDNGLKPGGGSNTGGGGGGGNPLAGGTAGAPSLENGGTGFRPGRPGGESATGVSAPTSGQEGGTGTTDQSGAVDAANKYLGMDENKDRAALAKFVGRDVRGNVNAWCAGFVNASLKEAGIKGTGSGVANSFQKWGREVAANDVRKGDVVNEHRNKGAGATGGHVGMATGNVKRDAQGNVTAIETISGNHGDKVAKEWLKVGDARNPLAIRRANEAKDRQDAPTASRDQPGAAQGPAKAGSLTERIEQEAKAAGIDPRLMHGIRAGESGHRNDYDVKSDRAEDSYGPFQLNRRGGLGQEFEEQTGLDARDPKTIGAQTKWVAEYIAKQRRRDPNWSPGKKWFGYKGLVQSDPRWGESGYRPDGGTTKVADADMAEVQGPMHPDDITRRSAFAGQKDKPKRWVQDPETEKWRPDFENDGSKPGAPNPNRPIDAGKRAEPAAMPDLEAARQQVEAHRREMERPIRIRYETDSNSGNVGHRGPVQAKREQESSMRSARYSSFSDVGVA